MKRLINLNSGPLEGTSARGPPLACGGRMGFTRSLRGLWMSTKALAREPSCEFAVPLLK